ncbi:hypothetical protein ACLOJK_003076 [Asimina triloba]
MRNRSGQDADRVSNLPPNVLQAVLMLLPIKDAVRTSILSSNWRYTWTAIPHLVFNGDCAPPSSYHSDLDHLRRVNIVDQVLLHHQGPIHKFELNRFLRFCPDVDRWILFLSNRGIQQLRLISWDGRLHKPSSRLFSCQHLRSLILVGFVIEPPPNISPLANLKTLVLCRLTITDVSLKRLLSACQFLQELELISFNGLSQIEILAQKLKRIRLRGSFQGLLLDTPLLAFAIIDTESLTDGVDEEGNGQMGESGICNLIKVLGGLRCIQKLKVRGHFLQSNAEETFDPHEFAWEAPGFKLNCLHSVDMGDIMGGKNELDLLEFVLANAPILDTMTVRIRCDIDDEAAFLRKLIRFRRASTQASIICLYYD